MTGEVFNIDRPLTEPPERRLLTGRGYGPLDKDQRLIPCPTCLTLQRVEWFRVKRGTTRWHSNCPVHGHFALNDKALVETLRTRAESQQ